jgi:ribose-phosphate pyrophosphokinase
MAAKGASAGMITAVIPHYAYARSDKKDASRISLGGRLVADLISTAGADRVLTMNLHAPQVHGFFSVPVDHLTALGVLAYHFREQDLDNTVVVSPDLGNAKGRHPVLAAARAARRCRVQAPARRRHRRHRLHRRRRRGQAGHRAR